MAPIGIFDSGVGGLSVLEELRTLLPEHPMIYFADQGWGPYGERTLAAVRERSLAITGYLLERGAGPIVVACNSASAAALAELRAAFPGVDFVGMEPAVKPAAADTANGVIGVLATEATFAGPLYEAVVDQHAVGVTVIAQPCPGLAWSVETAGPDAVATQDLLQEYLTPLRDAGVDTIVLGCTHYRFLVPRIRLLVDAHVRIVDPAPAVARQAAQLVTTPGDSGEIEYLTTGDPGVVADQIRVLTGVDASPGRVDIATDRTWV